MYQFLFLLEAYALTSSLSGMICLQIFPLLDPPQSLGFNPNITSLSTPSLIMQQIGFPVYSSYRLYYIQGAYHNLSSSSVLLIYILYIYINFKRDFPLTLF